MKPPSRLTLGIETSTRCIGVALLRGRDMLAGMERCSVRPQADDLSVMVDAVLRDAGASLADLAGVAVSLGPGSFTGLRIGISFVKGLAAGLPAASRDAAQAGAAIAVVGVPTLDVIAQNLWGACLAGRQSRGTIVVLLDARQGKAYAAAYASNARGLRRLTEDRLGTLVELQPLLKRGTLFTGDGLGVYQQALQRRLRRRLRIAPGELWWPRASTLARLGADAFAAGQRMDPTMLRPRYLYPQTCSITQAPA